MAAVPAVQRLPALQRARILEIYKLVSDWSGNSGEILYVAHAITANGAFCLGDPPEQDTRKSAKFHPDQRYWDKKVQARIDAAGGVRAIVRIEIDCTLTPCTGLGGCFWTVPSLVQKTTGLSVDLRIFSHRDEGMGKNDNMPKRYFECRSSDTHGDLEPKYERNGGWDWAAL
jgi:hypothetical protein